MSKNFKIWNGLAVIICSNLNSRYKDDRLRYLRYMINSIHKNTIQPQKIYMSYSGLRSEEDIPGVDYIYRGEKSISQMNHLLITIFELPEDIKYVVLADDDDMFSPYIIEECYKKWVDMKRPKLFVIRCAQTVGESYKSKDANVFSDDWKPYDEIFGESEASYNYGGSFYSIDVLRYYLRHLLYIGCDLTYTTADCFLADLTVINSPKIGSNYISEHNLDIYDEKPETYIHKARIYKPLYFWRKWRENKFDGSEESLRRIIDNIKIYGRA